MKTITKNSREAKKVLFNHGINIWFEKANSTIVSGNWIVKSSSIQCECGESFAYRCNNILTKEEIVVGICANCG